MSASAVHHESATLHTHIPSLVNLSSTPRMPQSTELSTLTEEWIKMAWYIHTKEYYSAKKRNAIESSVAMWMSLKPVIQWSESARAIHCYYSVTKSCLTLFVTPWTTARQASLPFTISRSLLKLMSMESVMLSNSLILCHPLLFLPCLSQHQGLYNDRLFTLTHIYGI